MPDRQHNGQHLVWNCMHYKSCVMPRWQLSRTSVQLGEPNGNDGRWTMTGTKCAAIKKLISIMRSGDKTEFINRLKTLQDMTVTCKQCEVTFVFTKGEQRFFQGKKMTQPARCSECRKWIREKRAETASKNPFQDSPSGPKFKTAIVAWAMCEG